MISKQIKMHFIDEKNPQKICLSQKCCTFAPSNEKNDRRSLILGYGVMVTQQILVLFFLVRVRVAQLHFYGEVLTERISHQFGLWCNGNTTDSGPVFLGSSPSSPTKKRYGIIPLFLLSVDTCPFQSGYTDWHYLLTFFFPVR